MENIPLFGAVVAIANHRNNKKDVPAIHMSLPRQAYTPAKNELKKGLKGAIRGPVMKASGALFFDRDDEHERSGILREMIRLGRAGRMILNFIEGTSQHKGQQLRSELNEGPVFVADVLGIDLTPIAIGGSEDPESKHIHVVAGRPISLEPLRDAPKGEIKRSKLIRDFTQEVVRPSLQEIVDYAYEKAA